MIIEIYWSDLVQEKQQEILDVMEYDENWAIFPIFVWEYYGDDET